MDVSAGPVAAELEAEALGKLENNKQLQITLEQAAKIMAGVLTYDDHPDVLDVQDSWVTKVEKEAALSVVRELVEEAADYVARTIP